jgi:RimJ/RimL family protein N-acetyltransferase
MKRYYKALSQQEFSNGIYKLMPIRDEDKYPIMDWRNAQIDILRQKEPLTKEKQEWYFKNVVDKLFEQEKPTQLLFSFLENDILVGYGGLVHIDWESKHGEISFITETKRNIQQQFSNDWGNYLNILKKIAGLNLNFNKIYTYAYDIRPVIFETLLKNHFIEEARLKDHIVINNVKHDVLIHSYFLNTISLRLANENDVLLYFKWANDEGVRHNSFNQAKIELDNHKKWFGKKINDSNCFMFVAYFQDEAVGQIRFDKNSESDYEIDFSIEKTFRGKGMGSNIIKEGAIALTYKTTSFRRIIGKVKEENISSKKSFIKAGFKQLPKANSEVDVYYFDNK